MKRLLTTLILATLCGCSTISDKIQHELTEEINKLLKSEPEENWQTAKHTINVDKLAKWRWQLKTGPIDRKSRPANGAAERMIVKFTFTDGKVYYWFRVGRNTGVKHRAKGAWDYHIGSPLAGIPEQGALWEWECVDGVLVFTLNGEMCRKYPMEIPGALLEKIEVNYEQGHRDIGCNFIAGDVVDLSGGGGE